MDGTAKLGGFHGFNQQIHGVLLMNPAPVLLTGTHHGPKPEAEWQREARKRSPIARQYHPKARKHHPNSKLLCFEGFSFPSRSQPSQKI